MAESPGQGSSTSGASSPRSSSSSGQMPIDVERTDNEHSDIEHETDSGHHSDDEDLCVDTRMESNGSDGPLDYSMKSQSDSVSRNHHQVKDHELTDRPNVIQPTNLPNQPISMHPNDSRSAFSNVPGHNIVTSRPPADPTGPLPSNQPFLPPPFFSPALLAAVASGQLPPPLPRPSVLTSAPSGLPQNFQQLQNTLTAYNNESIQSSGPPGNGLPNQPPTKVTRPFKAYNPMDPLSALNVSTNHSAFSPLQNFQPPQHPPPEPTSGPSKPFTDGLPNYHQIYRQYLLNAQANLLSGRPIDFPLPKTGPKHPVGHSHPIGFVGSGMLDASLPPQNGYGRRGSGSPKSSHGSTTPSPPQVTSTSHPHTDRTTPPALGPNLPGVRGLAQQAPANRLPIATSLPKAPCRPDVKAALEKSMAQDLRKQQQNELSKLLKQQTAHHNDGGGKLLESRRSTDTNSDAGSEKRRGVARSLPEEIKDEAYWERRRKNNEAAKRSRDARRQKEDEIAMRAAVLEQENLKLRIEVAQLRTETESLRKMLLHT